jgi:hypothetical protein
VLKRSGIRIAARQRMAAKTFNELAAWQRADELRRFVMEVTARPAVETTIRRAVSSCAGLERHLRSTTAPRSRST